MPDAETSQFQEEEEKRGGESKIEMKHTHTQKKKSMPRCRCQIARIRIMPLPSSHTRPASVRAKLGLGCLALGSRGGRTSALECCDACFTCPEGVGGREGKLWSGVVRGVWVRQAGGREDRQVSAWSQVGLLLAGQSRLGVAKTTLAANGAVVYRGVVATAMPAQLPWQQLRS